MDKFPVTTAEDRCRPLEFLSGVRFAGGHRSFLVLQGRQDDAIRAALSLLQTLLTTADDILWWGPLPVSGACLSLTPVDQARLRRRLGTECAVFVMDAFAGFDPEGFCMGAGMVPGGGMVILLAPPLSVWAETPDPGYCRHLPLGHPPVVPSRFQRWVAQCLHDAPSVRVLEAATLADYLADTPRPEDSPLPEAVPGVSRAAVLSQDAMLDALKICLDAPPPVSVLIRAERGRGKSTLLGRWLASLPASSGWRILLTGPDPQAVDRIMAFAQRPQWVFLPFDECLQVDADVLVIDEAAALPVPVLKQLLARFPRLVMASTLHGYEGSGQGLALRFLPWCERQGRSVHVLEGLLPMRWQEGDPLEAWIQTTFMLRESDVVAKAPSGAWGSPEWACWSRDDLLEHPDRLRAVMRLLTLAHYRTTPSDLRDLLDGPTLRVQVALEQGMLVGVVLVSVEGPVGDEALQADIMAGRRRPRGHLLPQALAWHCEAPECLAMRLARIVRIAVKPCRQGQGTGSWMLSRLRQDLAGEGIRYAGSSYAADPEVNRFWELNGFQLVREGRRRDQAGGEPSRLVLRAVDDSEDALVIGLAADYRAGREAIEGLVAGHFAAPGGDGSERWKRRLARFARGELTLDAAWPALCRWWWLEGSQSDIQPEAAWLTTLFSDTALAAEETGKRGVASRLRKILTLRPA